MKHNYIEDIGKQVGQEVTLRGWVHNRRSSGKIQFLIMRDGTGYVQAVVVKSAVTPEIFAAADSLTHESSFEVTGKVREDARAPGGYEVDVTNLKVFQAVSKEEPFPITPKSYRRKFLRDITGQTGYQQRKAQLMNALGRPEWPLAQRARHFWSKLGPQCVANAILFAGFAAAGVWWAYPLLWILPFLTWQMVITRIRNIAEHAVVPDSNDPLRNTRTTRARAGCSCSRSRPGSSAGCC